MNLFADLYLDEDVSVLVATLLLARATELGRCIVTHNRVDYERLHDIYSAGGQKHFGIIIGARRDAYELARRIAKLLDTLSADEIENQIFYI